MRQPIVAGNWKCHGSREFIGAMMADLKKGVAALSGVEVVLCPPAVYLDEVAFQAMKTDIKLAAQNVSQHDSGAFTGEIGAPMLAEMGCQYVIIGHSERRQLYGESDEVVAEKFIAAQRSNLTPIVCLGETLEEREQGQTEAVIGRQLDAVLTAAGISAFQNAVIAYEPVWAIGTGKTATPEMAQSVHAFIRQRLTAANAKVAEGVRLLYGGSVKAANAEALFAETDIDGGLIGGASLKADEFLNVCRAAV